MNDDEKPFLLAAYALLFSASQGDSAIAGSLARTFAEHLQAHPAASPEECFQVALEMVKEARAA